MKRARRSEATPWDGLNSSAIEPERRLFLAALVQAVQDLRRRDAKGENAAARTNALAWIFDPNEDFRVVCEIAGWHPDYVRGKAREILEGKCAHWRAEAGAAGRYEERKAYYKRTKL